MDGKLKVLALIGALLVAAAWTRADLQTGNAATSPQLISVALSTPPYNPLPGRSPLPVANPPFANPSAAMHNTSATNLWAGTAWSEYFSEPYHYQCGGKTAWQMRGAGGVGAGGHGAGGCAAGGCDAGGCDACGSSSSCHCFDRFLQNLTLFQRRCTACDDVASCDTCDTCDTCDSCSAAGGDQWDTGHEEPPQPELDQDMEDMQLDPMPEPMRDPMPEPMGDPVPEPMDPPMPKPMPKLPAPVTPPRNPLPKSASRPPRLILRSTPASFQASPQQRPRLVLQSRQLVQQPPRLVLESRQLVQQPPRLVLESRQLVQHPRRLVLEPPRQVETRQVETRQVETRQVETRQREVQPTQPTRLTQPGKAMLRFRTTASSVERPQQADLSLILLLSAEQR